MSIYDMYARILSRGRHITIHAVPIPGGITDCYCVTPNTKPGVLAWIRWYGPWKQWCFFPCEGTMWSLDCLGDVQKCIEELGQPAAAVPPDEGEKKRS